MKISKKGCYGLIALVHLASQGKRELVCLKEICNRQNISRKYLAHIMNLLTKAGFVHSIRGSRGGYQLSQSADKTKLSQIIQVLEGSVAPTDCVDNCQICPRAPDCSLRDVWAMVKEVIEKALESMTLLDLVYLQKRKAEKTENT